MSKNTKQTSKRVAKIDSALLKDPKSPKKVRSAAGSGLAQAELHKKRKTTPKKRV
jgi:hypothetical protein